MARNQEHVGLFVERAQSEQAESLPFENVALYIHSKDFPTFKTPAITIGILNTLYNQSAPHYFPRVEAWPNVLRQRGPNCGSYALGAAMKYCAYDGQTVPVPRKNGSKKHTTSVRQVAKERGHTEIGGIFNVDAMVDIAATFGFESRAHINPRGISEANYNSNIIALLKQGEVLIMPCDIDKYEYGQPGVSDSQHLHWVLLFSFFYDKDRNLFYIAAQDDEYFIFNAKRLYLSNEWMMPFNPLTRGAKFMAKKLDEDGLHYDYTNINLERFSKVEPSDDSPHRYRLFFEKDDKIPFTMTIKPAARCEEDSSLKRFRLCYVSMAKQQPPVPTLIPPKAIKSGV
jgi:hypothetical protein